MIDFGGLIRRLVEHHVEFVLVGGVAGTIHGSARFTQDVDIVYARAPENLRRVVAALADSGPYLRGVPPGLPFRWDSETLERGLNFTLTCTLGQIDLLGEITGGGGYAQLLPASVTARAWGVEFQVLDLPALIRVKLAAGRPKDLETVAELEALFAARKRNPQ